MFDWLTQAVSGSAISYLVVLAASGGDVVFPPVPSETIVITGGVLAGRGDLIVWLVILAASTGAMLGDNLAYWLGRKIGDPLADRVFRGDKGRERLDWAERAIGNHGPLLVVVGRFIPGGRTASTFAAGTLEMPWRRFIVFNALGAALWVATWTSLGYLAGNHVETIARDFTYFAIAAAVVVVGLGLWHLRRHRQRKKAA